MNEHSPSLGKTPGSGQDSIASSEGSSARQLLRRESSLSAHWNDTIRSLDLRGLLLAGMAVFLTYFSIDYSGIPEFLVINGYLTVLAFAVVVCRLHIFQSIEPDMSAWWDQTIIFTTKRNRIADFALEGPWLFVLMAMPFSTISMVAFGAAYLVWSAMECGFLCIGRKSLRATPADRLGDEIAQLVHRYYDVRIQHEAIACAITASILGATILASVTSRMWLWYDGVALVAMLVLLTVVEVKRNPWFWTDLSLAQETLDPKPD